MYSRGRCPQLARDRGLTEYLRVELIYPFNGQIKTAEQWTTQQYGDWYIDAWVGYS